MLTAASIYLPTFFQENAYCCLRTLATGARAKAGCLYIQPSLCLSHRLPTLFHELNDVP